MIRIEIERGDFMEFRYDLDGQAIPHKSMLNGKVFGPKATAVMLKAFQIREPLRFADRGNNIYQIKGSAPRSPRVEFGFQKAQYFNDEALCEGDPQCLQEIQDQACAMNPACFGIWDSVNSFIGNLANWAGVAGAVGGTIGLVTGVYAGLELAALATVSALFAATGIAVVVVGTTGYLVGTVINGGIEWVMYRYP